MKKYVFALLSIGLIIFSCNKDDDDDDDQSKMKLITSATWKYDTAAIDYDKDGKAETKIPAGTISTCDLDNTITFKTDSTGTLDEGATRCSTSDPQSTTIKWWFKDNESVLYSPDPIFGGLSGDAKILVLTSTKLQVIKEISITGLSTTVNIVIDLKH